MSAETTYNAEYAIQVGDDHYVLSPAISSFESNETFRVVEYPVIGSRFPLVLPADTIAGTLSINGLLFRDGSGVSAEDVIGRGGEQFTFAVYGRGAAGDTAGPAGYAVFSEDAIVDTDGVFNLNAASLATARNGLPKWQYGVTLPQARNVNRTAGIAYNGYTYPQPVGGMWGMIHVLERGNITDLELRYTASGKTYEVQAVIRNSRVEPQLTIGQFKQFNNIIPSGNARLNGTYRINVTGSGGKFYCAVFNEE